MQFGRFRIGMRTMKTALAVMICIIIFHFTNRGQPMIAALAAVFSLRQDLTTTVSFGKSRVIGNTIGGIMAVVYFFIKQYFHSDFLIEVTVLPLLVALVIIISDGINNNSGIISAIATMLLITMSITRDQSAAYAMQRVVDTFIGTFVAISINFVLRPPEKEKAQEITEDLEVLKRKEEKLQIMLMDVQKELQKERAKSEENEPKEK